MPAKKTRSLKVLHNSLRCQLQDPNYVSWVWEVQRKTKLEILKYMPCKNQRE